MVKFVFSFRNPTLMYDADTKLLFSAVKVGHSMAISVKIISWIIQLLVYSATWDEYFKIKL